MSKITFNYGVMGSSKSAELLMAQHRFRRKGDQALLIKPAIDSRQTTIKSRIGLEEEADFILGDYDNFTIFEIMHHIGVVSTMGPLHILIDEAQMLPESFVRDFSEAMKEYDNVDVIYYGLLMDYKGHMFATSKAIIENADKLIEIPSICEVKGCQNKATHHLLYHDGEVVKKGETLHIGDSEFRSVCLDHFYLGYGGMKHEYAQ